MANAAPTDEQLQFIRRVLIKKERPLSWESFGQELEKYNCSFSLQSVQYVLGKKAVPGILHSRDFITLDTPRNVGLLKLQLVVAVNEKINGGRFSKANHYFHIVASDEERSELGNNEDTLTKSILEFGDIFIMPSLSSSEDSYKMVQLKTEFFFLHRSFFAYEKDSQASAIHKLKYFLFLCHGSTGIRSAFEFSRCLLTKEEKCFFARHTFEDFEKAVKPLIPSIGISGDTVTSTPSLVSNQEKETKGDDQCPKPNKTLDVLDEKDIALFKDILQEGPLSWKVFLTQLELRRPNTYSVALREMFRQSQPDGLIHSPDFVSLNDVKSTGLAKLQFIVFVNNKSGDVSLNKVSSNFTMFGSDEEREEFGRSFDGILQSLLKYKDLFLLPLDGGNQRSVKCGPRAIPFDSFFQLEGKSEESFNHKLKYFVNLCGGTCTMSSAFEFSRNLLSKDEKRLFVCNKEPFFELVTSQKSFTITADKIQLCKSHLGSTPLEAATLLPVVPKIPNSGDDQCPKPNKTLDVLDEKDIALFKDILQEGPLSWKVFLTQLELRRPNTYSVALREMFRQSQPDGLIHSPDFVSLNDIKSTGLAKLQFIVFVNNKSGDVSLNKVSSNFTMFGSDEEREEFGRSFDGILQSLLKYKDLFLLPLDGGNQRSVKCGPRAIPFDSFFQLEGKSEESFNHKLKYFVNLCGGTCTMSSAFEFSRNLLSKDEKRLFVCNKEPFFELVTSQKSFTITADKIQLCKSHLGSTPLEAATLLPVVPKIPNSGDDQCPKPNKTLDVLDEKDIALFKDILQEGPLSWKVFLTQLELRRPNTYSVALREMFRQSQPDGLIHSPDFVSLNDIKSTGLAKLQFIVFVNNKSGDVSLNKVSSNFTMFGSDEEREEFGRSFDGILQSLLKYKDLFLLPLDGGNQRSVKCGPRAIPFDSFFQLEGKSEESFNHKLKYFVNLCGGTCTMSSAFEFSRNLLSKDEKRLFVCNKEPFFELVTSQKSFTITADKIQLCKSHLGSTPLEAATLLPVVPKIPNSEIPEERKSNANKKLRSIQCILEQQKQAVALWRNFDGNLYTCEERSCWVREFIDIYLPTLEPFALICTEEFVSLNTPEDRAFLKVCLMASMSIKCKKTCTIETLFKQAFDIGSVRERRSFYSDFESYVKSYPSVFVITEKSLLEKVVQSGSDMPLFEDLFGVCTDHGEESCLRCLLEFFLYLSGGVSHFSRAFAFVKLMVDLGEVAAKSITKMEESDFETLVKSCDRILLSEELILTLVGPLSSYSVASKERKETSEHTPDHSHDAPWPIGRCKYNEEGSDKKASVSPPSQEKLLALPAPSEASTASSSIRPKDGDQVQSTPEEDALSTTSSTVSKSARRRANKKKKKEAAAAVVSMTTKPKVDVYVQVIKDDLTLDQLIKKMQNHSRPIMSVVHSTDALVVVDWFGAGFILPVPKNGFVGSNRWSRMNQFFADPHIVVVTFDCETVGRFLWQRMSLKLVTVFDIKSGVHLMFTETENHMPSCNSVGKMCQHFKREGPDSVNAHVIGNLEFDEEQIQLGREEVLSAVQNAAVLVPSVYSWILQELESRSALNELHTLTMEKLKLLDTKAIVDTTMSASIDSSTRTTPLPQSSTSSSSSVRSSHSYEWKNAMVPFTENSSSFSTSLPKKGIVPSQCLAPVIPPQDDWFSEELGEPAGIPVALESSYDQETYCLRKVDNSSIYPVPQEEAESYDSNLSNLTSELISQYSQSNAENIVQLLTLLGNDIFTTLGSELKDQSKRTVEDLSEITLHVGRRATARFYQKTNSEQPVEVDASSKVTTSKDLEEIEKNDALTGFDDYNRCGVEGCLHNIRGIRNRKKKLIGLTVRVALPLLGCADMMYDIALSDKSTLILGRHGVGKTTLLRELARCLSDTEGNKVVVIDTYNEIAGDCDTPHFSIGRASRLQVSLGETSRSLENVSESKLMRMLAIFITDGEAYKQTCVQVDSPYQQHQVITESAKNHNPNVVIIDLIELPSDVSAISRICKEGIKVIVGVSRDSVSSLIHDENLSQMFKVGDSNFLDDMSSLDSAGALAKSKLRPVFEALVEMKETDCWHIHDLIYTLSNVRNGQAYRVQERTRIGLNRRQPGWEQEILLMEKVINPHNELH